MNLYQQTADLTLMGQQVKTFPNGIKEAFENLMEAFGRDRPFYGVSWLDESDNVIYYAMTTEAFPGEGKDQGYQIFNLAKGQYETELVQDWQSKTDCIKDVFQRLMGKNKPDKNHPCIEWYRNDSEMLCMITSPDCHA